jgi:hypothetical protein
MLDFVQTFPGGIWGVLILLAAFAAGWSLTGLLKK